MNLLSVENISKSFGPKTLFKDISFGINKGQKVALVAKNGTGKTTLLNILSGRDTPDSGSVVFRNDQRVTYLEQDPQLDVRKCFAGGIRWRYARAERDTGLRAFCSIVRERCFGKEF